MLRMLSLENCTIIFLLNHPIIAFSNLDSDLNEIITKTNSGKVFDYINEIDLKKSYFRTL